MKKIVYLIGVLILSHTCVLSQVPEQVIYANESCQGILPDYTQQITVNDNCSGPVILEQSPPQGTLLTSANPSIEVMVTGVDQFGNIAILTIPVSLVDTIPPVIYPVDPMDKTYIEGIDTVITSHGGYDASNTTEKVIVFRNNRVESSLDGGFMLQVGQDNYYDTYANKRDYSEVTGNYFLWNGTDPGVHCIMAGYNEHYDIRYNFLDGPTYGVIHEGGYPGGQPMQGGDICYNIFRNTKYAVPEKGYDGTRIYNNTFYTGVTFSFSYQLSIKASDTGGFDEPYPESKNTDVRNNIFYATGNTIAIILESTEGFQCDYNIYYWESTTNHEPIFRVDGQGVSWDEWRAMGYDTHSVILDPGFIDTHSLVPASRLNHGISLGSEYAEGLSVGAQWIVGSFIPTTLQDSNWQVGTYVY